MLFYCNILHNDYIILYYIIYIHKESVYKWGGLDLFNTIQWTGASYDRNNLKSINQVLGNYTSSLNYPDWTSGYLTLLALRKLYLTCSEFSDAKQLGSTGAYNIVKKIPINVPFGSVIYDNKIISVDYINVSNRVLRTLHFKLVNSYGNVVDLNNVNCSFSLTFIEDD